MVNVVFAPLAIIQTQMANVYRIANFLVLHVKTINPKNVLHVIEVQLFLEQLVKLILIVITIIIVLIVEPELVILL